MYHYITICIVMRDCKNEADAVAKCSRLMPYKPDENTTYMESWAIAEVATPKSSNEPQVLAP
jgi:hypothetical protein